MFIISLIIAAVSVIADQLIKYIVNNSIELNGSVDFIPHVLSLTHIRNKGAAWSIMEGQTWFLVLMPIAVIAVALIYMYKNRDGSKIMLTSLALVMGGGVGNLIDRVRMHEVIDYLKCELFNFPIFNFADICVVVGAAMFCVYMIFIEGKKTAPEQPAENAQTVPTEEQADEQ